MRRILTVVGLLLMLGGCALAKAPDDVEAAAKDVYAKLAAGDVAGLKAMSRPDLRAQETPELIGQMRAQIPDEKPTSDQTTFWQVSASTGAGTQAGVKRTYSYPRGQVLFEVLLEKQDGAWTIAGMHVTRVQPGASTANDFKLEGKFATNYVVLAGAILSPLICLFAFIRVLSAPKFPWKWAFAILSLLAFVQIGVNWTTGVGWWQLLNVALLGAGFFKGASPLDPWTLWFNLPIGAAIALWRSGKARREKAAAAVASFQ